MSNIQWTDLTINPIHLIRENGSNGGHFCVKVSPECKNCYAETINQSNYFAFASHLKYAGKAPKNMIFDEKVMLSVLGMKSAKKIFVWSMTDPWGKWVPNEWLDRAFAIMKLAKQHTFQVLTKRPDRMKDYWLAPDRSQKILDMMLYYTADPANNNGLSVELPIPNVWLGASAGTQKTLDKFMPDLIATPAVVHFLSCEPLLEEINLSEFLSYAIRQTSRRSHLSGDSRQGNGDRFRRQYLEGRQEGVGQVESMHSIEQVQSGTSRNKESRLSACQSDVQQGEVSDGCSPPSVPTLLRQDPRRDDHQSQGWEQKKQPSVESGASNTFSAAATRIGRSQEGQSVESVGRKEFDVQSDIGSSTRNQTEESVRGISEIDRTRLWDQIPSSVQNMPGSAMEGNFWLICGGESGPGARPCHIDWIRSLVRQCQQTNTAVFVKQWGSHAIDSTPYIDGVVQNHFQVKLKNRKGGDIAEFPLDLQIREFPPLLGK